MRDAAAYVLWATARALEPSGVSVAMGSALATRLVSVALYDQEVHVRRAASAAYQELVGRWVSVKVGPASAKSL